MNSQSLIINQSLTTIRQSAADKTTRLIKLLVFRVGSLTVAFHIDSVQKVINYMPVHGSGTTPMGIIHLGDREVTTIDLHKRLFKVSKTLESQEKQYLILVKNSVGEQFGVLMSETPTLIDVPLSEIRALPESYRRSDTLQIASHVTVISPKNNPTTIFLLDTDQLVSASINRNN